MEAKDVFFGRRYVAMINGKRTVITVGDRISQEPPTWECRDESGRRFFVLLGELIEPVRFPKREDRSTEDPDKGQS